MDVALTSQYFPQTLRPYQRKAVDAIHASWANPVTFAPAISLATGGGKTTCIAQTLAEALQHPWQRALVLGHTEEIIFQLYERILNQFNGALSPSDASWDDGQSIGIVMGDKFNNPAARVVVATRQSLHAKRLPKLLEYGVFDFLIVDEAHHAASGSYQFIVKALRAANPDLKILGVSATLMRSDRLTLKTVFTNIAYEWSIEDGITQGFLVPPTRIKVQTNVDLRSVKTEQGDYKQNEMLSALKAENWLELCVEAYRKHVIPLNRLTMAFWPSVAMSQEFAAFLAADGYQIAHLDGETPKEERRDILARYRERKLMAVSNVGVLTEGADVPETGCIFLARPTRSRTLFCLDKETEILTPTGWKRWNEVKQGDTVASYWPETQEITWDQATDYVARPLFPDEKMYSYQSPTLDFRVTDRHRMLWRDPKHKEWCFEFALARDLAVRRTGFDLPVAGCQKAKGIPLTDDEIRFIGWFVTDGTRNKKTNSIQISQASHQPQNADIVKCLEGCGFKYRIYRNRWKSNFNETSERLVYHISKGKPRGEDTHLRGWGDLEAYIDKDLSPALEDMTADQLDVFLEAVHLGDGAKQLGQYWTRHTYHIGKGNMIFAERLQSLCVRRGFRCNMTTRDNPNGNPLYILHIRRESTRHVGGIGAKDRPSIQESLTTSDDIAWCVTVPSTAIVTRRNGKVLITGNTQILGRGLRPFPGKSDCILVDMSVNDTKALTIGTLLGKIYTCPVCDAEYYDRRKPCPVCGYLHKPQKMGPRGENDDEPFTASLGDAVLSSVFENAFAAWHGDANGWSTTLGDAGTLLIIAPKEDSYYRLLHIPKNNYERVIVLQQNEDVASLMLDAEREVKARAEKLGDRNAPWRERPASPGQLKWLQSLRMPSHTGLTCGEASSLITHGEALKRIQGMKFTTHERVGA